MSGILSYSFLAPPTVFIALSLVAALVALRWRRTGTTLMLASSLCLFVAALPVVSAGLLAAVEAELPQQADFSGAQAIVVLGGDVQVGGDNIPDALGLLSLERVRLAAQAYRQLKLPVAVSGGRVGRARASEGELLRAALERDFAVPVAWEEDRSRTTWENALYTAQILRSENIASVVVVTQAWHLPRAIWCFKRVGLTAVPWPAPRAAPRTRVASFLPSIAALHDTFYALHELLGLAYYRLRH